MTGVELIAHERARQMGEEGWSFAHDDSHRSGQLVIAATRYALAHTKFETAKTAIACSWRWSSCWWKPRDPIRNLVRAGALIAAEIDRLQRRDAVYLPAEGKSVNAGATSSVKGATASAQRSSSCR